MSRYRHFVLVFSLLLFSRLQPAFAQTPVLTAISPNATLVGGGGFTLTVDGTDFLANSEVRWSGSSRTTTFVSATQLTASIQASDISVAGTFNVTVFNPGVGGGTSATATFTVNNPGPSVTTLSPNAATVSGAGFTLTVNGGNFVNGATVLWNGAARTTTFVSSAQLTASIPSSDLAVVAVVPISVSNPVPGGGASNSVNFVVTPSSVPLVIATTSPLPSGTAFTSYSQTLSATGGSPAYAWSVSNGSLPTGLSLNSASGLIGGNPNASGVFLFTARVTDAGSATTTKDFSISISSPSPTISTLVPAATLIGTPGLALTVNGSGFVTNSAVQWNGAARSTSFVSTSQLSVSIPASDLVSAGSASVTVVNPPPGGGTSNAASFSINNPTPALVSLSPSSALAGSAALTLTVNGSAFVTGATVQWNGASRTTTFVSGSQLTADIPAGDLASAGTASVTVLNLGPGGGTSNSLTFSVNNPVPVASNLSPDQTTAGGGGFTLTVNGSSYVSGASVRWNGSARATTFVSSSQLTASMLASDIATAGTASVSVVNPSPGGGASGALTFTVNNPVPGLSSLSPNPVIAGSAAFTLTVGGSNFVAGSVLQWNGAARTTTYVSATQITASIPATDVASAGTANITVFNAAPAGGTSSALPLTINNPVPGVSSLSQTTVAAGGASFNLTIFGANFLNGVSVVRWNGTDRPTSFISTGQLTALISAADIESPGTAAVSVFHPLPAGGTSSFLNVIILPSISITATVPVTSEAASSPGAFTITRTGNPGAPLTVNFTTTGTATAGSDYTALPTSLTIPAGASSAPLPVAPIDDSVVEGNETVAVSLAPNASYLVSSASATVTLVDDDVETSVSVLATIPSASEAGIAGQFTVLRTGSLSAALTVNYIIGGGATAGADYVTLASAVTVPAGSASAAVPVTPLNDSLVEGSETVTVSIGSGQGYVVGSPAAATVTIVDDDALPVVSILASDAVASEAGLDPGSFTIFRTGGTSAPLTVGYSVTGTAILGLDYVALQGTVTIPVGETSVTVSVTPLDDLLVEGNETIVATLATGSGFVLGPFASATVTLADDDVPAPSVSVLAVNALVPESGSNPGSVAFVRTGSTNASLTVTYSIGGTASAGVDYTALSGTVTIPAGTAYVVITITPIEDSVVEGNETIILTLDSSPAYSIGAPTSVSLLLIDNEATTPTTVSLLAADPLAAEAGSDPGMLTFVRSGDASGPLLVNFTVGGTATPGSDYAALTGMVTLPAGEAAVTLAVVPVNDAMVEGNETVVVTLAAGTGYTVGTPLSATLTIVDDDSVASPTLVSVVAADLIAAEAGLNVGSFAISRSGDLSVPLTVAYTMSGSATPGLDYLTPSGNVTLPAGASSASISITPVDDSLVEGNETIILNLQSSESYFPGTPSVAVVTLVDNDPPASPLVSILATSPVASESGLAGSVMLIRTGDVGLPLTVSLAISGSATPGVDYLALPSSMTIAAGSVTASIVVNPLDDTQIETLEMVVLSVVPNSAYQVGIPASATVTIADNDVSGIPAVSILATDPVAAEAGLDPGTFTLIRNGNASAALTVNYSVSGSATAGIDYVPLAGSVTFPAGQVSVPITLVPLQDNLAETTETIVVTLSSGSSYSVSFPVSATIALVDDDVSTPTVSLVVIDESASEAGLDPATFLLLRSGNTSSALNVTYSLSGTATAGTDYALLPNSLNLPAGAFWASFSVVPLDDAIAEPEETVTISLSQGASYNLGVPSTGTLAIVDNDSVTSPGPHLTKISPSSFTAGGGTFVLIAKGSNFAGDSVIQWNGSNRPTVFISSVQLAATIPTGDIASAGTATVTIFNPGENAGQSDALSVTIFSPSTPPPLSITTTPPLPGGMVGTLFAYGLEATGGKTPYSWDLVGSLPPGVTLDITTGIIKGVPVAAGTFSFTARVHDSLQVLATQLLQIQVALPLLSITTTSPLPEGTGGGAYATNLNAVGGLLPYSWSVLSGSLPPGLQLNGQTGEISGIPLGVGLFSFAVQVMDATESVASKSLSLNLKVPPLPAVTVSGLPGIVEPGQQPKVAVNLAGPYPLPLVGQLILSFTPNADNPANDPTIQFSSGGQTVGFTIPANQLQGLFAGGAGEIGLQSGTVAGSVEVRAVLQAGTVDVTPTPEPTGRGDVGRLPPKITSLTLGSRTASAFEISIVGYSTLRSLSQAVFRFNSRSGSSLQTSSLTLDLGSLFTGWYQSTASQAFGSQFRLTVPFSIQGDANALGSISVTLANSVGSSDSSAVNF